MVGLLFCFSKLARAGSIFKAFTDAICNFIDHHTEIVVGVRQPADASKAGQRLFDIIFDLNGDHHRRGANGEGKSNLYRHFMWPTRLRLGAASLVIYKVCTPTLDTAGLKIKTQPVVRSVRTAATAARARAGLTNIRSAVGARGGAGPRGRRPRGLRRSCTQRGLGSRGCRPRRGRRPRGLRRSCTQRRRRRRRV